MMNRLIDRPIRKYNPGTFQSDEEVIAQFRIRERELKSVIDVLRGNIYSSSSQHILVVGSRGQGKTMLLARVAAELRGDDELHSGLLPVRFMEENHELFQLADFWLETLFQLARESAANDPDLARELRETHADLTGRWMEREFEEQARTAVLEVADRLDKKLVVMVENLQALCENLGDDFGSQLRSVLESVPQIILLGTATSRPKGLDEASQPFFELFQILRLQPLSTDECCKLWALATGEEVSKSEIRPLEILTGGNPRLLIIVAGFAQHRSLRQLIEDLVKLVDEHTEYFRSHLEDLGMTERRVYIAVIDLWQASSTREIAARARMDVRVVSTLLGRLVGRGVVTMEGNGKKRRYSAERLYSIYYKLRRERDKAAVVAHLIDFMVVFYSKAELFAMCDMEAAQSDAIREGIAKAQPAFERPADQAATIDDETLAPSSASDDVLSQRLDAVEMVKEGEKQKERGEYEAALTTFAEVDDCFCASDDLELLGRVAWALHMTGDIQMMCGYPDKATAAWDEVLDRFGTSDNTELRLQVASVLRHKGEIQSNDAAAIKIWDEAVDRFGASDDSNLQWQIARILRHKGERQKELGEVPAAITTWDEIVDRFGASDDPELQALIAEALYTKGMTEIESGCTQEALHTCKELEKRLGSLADDERPEFEWRVMWVRVKALLVQGKYGAALKAFRIAHAMFVPGNKAIIREILQGVPDLISAGAKEHDLVEILSSDREKSDALAPLVVALRQRNREEVRGPAEVLEVAADIRARVKGKRQFDPSFS